MANNKHGYSYTRTYKSWGLMKSRCNNPNLSNNYIYFDRGIKYCEDWENFENFLVDMGDRPEGTSLDRIDNDKGYSKENCRWATFKEQSRNRRDNQLLNGKTLSEWSEILGIKRSTLAQRFYVYGWSVDRVLSV